MGVLEDLPEIDAYDIPVFPLSLRDHFFIFQRCSHLYGPFPLPPAPLYLHRGDHLHHRNCNQRGEEEDVRVVYCPHLWYLCRIRYCRIHGCLPLTERCSHYLSDRDPVDAVCCLDPLLRKVTGESFSGNTPPFLYLTQFRESWWLYGYLIFIVHK